jgi:hypothetical protein
MRAAVTADSADPAVWPAKLWWCQCRGVVGACLRLKTAAAAHQACSLCGVVRFQLLAVSVLRSGALLQSGAASAYQHVQWVSRCAAGSAA